MKTKPVPLLFRGQLAVLALFATAPVAPATLLYHWDFNGASGIPVTSTGGGSLALFDIANFDAVGVTGAPGDNALSVSNTYTGGTGISARATASDGEILTGPGTLDTFTITMWVNLTAGDFVSGRFPRLFQVGPAANPDNTNPSISLLLNGGNMEFGVNSFKNAAAIPGLNTATVGKWVFLAFTYDGTSTPTGSATNTTLYGTGNNAVMFSGTTTGNVAVGPSFGLNNAGASPGPIAMANAANLQLGDRVTTGRGLTGLMDEIRFYDTQLTVAELEAIRAASAPPPPPGGVPTYWKGTTSGTWTAANWTSDAAGTAAAPLATNGTGSAIFAATGAANLDTTLLGANQSVASLKFNAASALAPSGTLTIGGTHDLTIGAAGTTLDAGAGQIRLNTTGQILLGANQTWTNLSAFPFTVASRIGGAFALSTAGPGTTVLSAANLHTGGTIIESGTLQLGNPLALGPLTNSLIMGGGTLNLAGFSPEIASLNGAGTVTNTVDGTSTLTINTPTGATDTFSGAINNGSATAFTALTKSGPGSLILVGQGNYTGPIEVQAGLLNAASGVFGVNNNSSLGSLNATGRVITVRSGAILRFGINNALGNQNNDAALIPRIILDGGTLEAIRYNVIGDILLNAATLSNATQETSVWHGYQFRGTVTAGGAAESFISSPNGRGNHLGPATAFEVAENATLTVSTPLFEQSPDFASAPGSLVKRGPGSLTLSGVNTYTGPTTVEQGILVLGNPTTLSDTAPIDIISPGPTGARLSLDFTGEEVVSAFLINGVSPGGGTYGRIGSGATQEYAWITGDGLISTPVTDPYPAWIDAFYPDPNDPNRDKAADPDKDGQNNLTEFAFDSPPNSGTASGKVRVRLEAVSGSQALVITFPARDGAIFTGTTPATASLAAETLTYTVQGGNSPGLFNQPVSPVTAQTAGLPALSSGWTYQAFRLDGNVGGGTPRGPRGFLRLGISTP